MLKAIPGVELVEMERIKEAAWCCGAGGGAREAYPEFSEWTASERIEEAESTGADALVTACPWCERNFIDAVQGQSRSCRSWTFCSSSTGPLSGRIRNNGNLQRRLSRHRRHRRTDNVTDDPAFLDSYAFQWLAELVRPNRSHYMPRPWAVVMPASTGEVQAVTKVCNKYRIKIKPISTGWYHWAAPMKDNEPTVQLDLRRMNRIIDIDEKNRFAIVEPYVICAQLQAEVMKRGLNINIIGAGSSTSVVASACAYFGGGPSSYYMGNNSDNLLGQEWVTPAGKIVRTGSLSSGAAGSARKARAPACGASPEASSVHAAVWAPTRNAPSSWRIGRVRRVWTSRAAAGLSAADPRKFPRLHDRCAKLGRVGGVLLRDLRQRDRLHLSPPVQSGRRRSGPRSVADLHRSDQDAQRRRNARQGSGDHRDHRGSADFVPVDPRGQLRRGIQLQDKILDEILEQTGCYKVKRYCEQDMAEFTNMYMQRLGHKHCNFIWAGGYMGSWMQAGTPDFVKNYVPTAIEGFEGTRRAISWSSAAATP